MGASRRRSRWALLLWACGAARAADFGDTGEIFATPWVSNPVGRHTACPVAHNTPTVCTLVGWEFNDNALVYLVQTLPQVGLLYATSSNYISLGSEPLHAPDPIGPHMLPFVVTDPLHRLVYVPPMNTWPPDGDWASFVYRVTVNQTAAAGMLPAPPTELSEEAVVVLPNIEGKVSVSNFDNYDVQSGGWRVSGNLAEAKVAGGLRHEAVITGGLSHYVYGTDEVQYLDFATGLERSKWYFEASPQEFYRKEMALGYGGSLSFTVRSLYGNFSEMNAPLDWITIECDACANGRGKRIIRHVDEFVRWEGGLEHRVEVFLHPVGRWHLDPFNSALNYTFADECDIAVILSNVTRLAILGDFTRGGEGVALDDVEVKAAPASLQPAYPLNCQRGCRCAHNEQIMRPGCC